MYYKINVENKTTLGILNVKYCNDQYVRNVEDYNQNKNAFKGYLKGKLVDLKIFYSNTG